ncbi:TnpV protein [Faecalicatena sp. BF-R-105]|nr:TnpV protein [Faecalicatena sp. BF-R-105]
MNLVSTDKEPHYGKYGMMRQTMEKQGITEEMKACDQMEWVRAVNGIRNMAEEQRMFELKQRKKREKC